MDDVIKLADQKLTSISVEDWQRRCQHVRNIEQQLMNARREFVLHVSGESDDTSDDSFDSSGGDEEGRACGDDIYANIAGVDP
jgi:hypothetical protein